MEAHRTSYLTPEEYLAIERQAETRRELSWLARQRGLAGL